MKLEDWKSKHPDEWPKYYLHVHECRSGEQWIVPIKGNASLDLKTRVKAWIKEEFGGEMILNGRLIPKIDGDYYAKIMTDGRDPDSVVCWEGAGFFVH